MANWKPKPMTKNDDIYSFNNTIPFTGTYNLTNKELDESFEFAYKMAYDELHRNHRSGGTHQRRNTEIFVDALQGKLSEFFTQKVFIEAGINVSEVDINLYDRGEWDSEDLSAFTSKGKETKITIKSTKHFGNLMLLETKDWDKEACYIPSGELGMYGVFVLVRVKFELESILKSKRLYFSDDIDKESLREIFKSVTSNNQLKFDIPGILYRNDIKKILSEKQIIKKGNKLNSTVMDADNYYVQSGNMRPINELLTILNNN